MLKMKEEFKNLKIQRLDSNEHGKTSIVDVIKQEIENINRDNSAINNSMIEQYKMFECEMSRFKCKKYFFL